MAGMDAQGDHWSAVGSHDRDAQRDHRNRVFVSFETNMGWISFMAGMPRDHWSAVGSHDRDAQGITGARSVPMTGDAQGITGTGYLSHLRQTWLDFIHGRDAQGDHWSAASSRDR